MYLLIHFIISGMQNSAASCFIVSLIDLAAAAVVGTFAIIQKQVSACMVTGVLYCMAGRYTNRARGYKTFSRAQLC